MSRQSIQPNLPPRVYAHAREAARFSPMPDAGSNADGGHDNPKHN